MEAKPQHQHKKFGLLQEIEEKQLILQEEYYFNVRQSEQYWERDNEKALRIQSIYKMYRCYKLFKRQKEAVLKVQRRFRGFIARIKFQRRKEDDTNRKNIIYFSEQAIIIQKVFRGYYQRKFTHDFYARQKFLKELSDQNNRFQQEINTVAKDEELEEKKRLEAQAREEFTQLAKNLHHLSSTYQIPGVYNPPYAIARPTAFNVEVETHLKTTFKVNYTWKPPTKKDINKFTIKPIKKVI